MLADEAIDTGHGIPITDAQALPGARPSECGSLRSDRWYVVQTHRAAERLAADELRKQDFQSFLPLILRRPKPPVPGAPRRHRKVEAEPVLAPAYPRYLFVLFDLQRDRWRAICSTRGVARLFGASPERPTPVPEAVMAKLLLRASKWQREAERDAQRRADRLTILLPGEVVVVRSALFAGADAVVVNDDGRRTRVLLLTWNREVEVPRAEVEPTRQDVAADGDE